MIPRTEDHLALYSQVDIALDPFPYNGTTTTCEALWMGVPVVTLRGDRHAARVGASILEHAGYPEWVAPTLASYIETAVRLASNPEALGSIRSAMRSRIKASPLCDADTFAQSVEKAYQDMWKNYTASR
jgi:predicted O-linked N-acetylglucosamine transferase (SPINDLY family)